MTAPRKPRVPRVCATCRRGPAQNVSIYRIVAGGPWKCWDHLALEERRLCIR